MVNTPITRTATKAKNQLLSNESPADLSTESRVLLDAINKVNANVETFKQEFEEANDKLSTKINGIAKDMKKMETEINSKFKAVNKDLSNIKTTISNTSDELERFKREKDLKVNGIPYTSTEDVYKIYEKISSAIKLPSAPTADVYRAGKSNSSPIFIKFLLKSDKINFFKAYLALDGLKLNAIGWDSEERIYVCGNLTTVNYKFLKAALIMKRHHHIHKVSTHNGLIYIKIKDSDNGIVVSLLEQLKSINPQAETTE